MKIGFVVECVDQGPETKVIPRLANLVDTTLECEVEPLGSKPKVLRDCGRTARALLKNTYCDRVIIIWDARPPTVEARNILLTPAQEKEKAIVSLTSAGLAQDPRITLICIIQELEAWLLSDGRGVTHRINNLGKIKLKNNIVDQKNVEHIPWPKKTMEKIFRTMKVRPYNDWLDAEGIAEGIPGPKRLLKHSAIFPAFAAALK